MIDVTVSTAIDRPVEEVFRFVADMTNEHRWHTDVVEATRIDSGELGTGSRYQVRLRSQPMSPDEAVVEITGFDPGRAVVASSDMGSMSPTVTHHFEPVDGGTRVTRRIQVETTGLMSLMAPVMGMMVRRRNRRFIGNLKQVLEA